MQDYELIGESDQANLRVIKLEGGNHINLKRTDPFGFWSVHYEKGQVPSNLQGNYTSAEEARQATLGYLKDIKKNVKE